MPAACQGRSACWPTPTPRPNSSRALGRFLADNPKVRVDLEERLSDEIVGLIAGDIGIVAGTVDVGGLGQLPSAPTASWWWRRRTTLAAQARVAFAQVLAFDLVGLERTSALQRFLADKAARLGSSLNLRVQLRSFDAVCRLVEAGVGVGVVPQSTAARVAQAKPLSVIELEDDWAVRDLTLCVRRFADLRPYAQDLVRSLRA